MRSIMFASIILCLLFGCKERIGHAQTSTPKTITPTNDSLVYFNRDEATDLALQVLQIEVDINQPGDTTVVTTTKHFLTGNDSVVSSAKFCILNEPYNALVSSTGNLHETHLGKIIFYEEKFQKENGSYLADQEIIMELFYNKSDGFYGKITNTESMRSNGQLAFKPQEAIRVFLAH